MWLKSSPNLIHTPNPYAASDVAHIFRLPGRFFLWFSAKNEIKAYFNAKYAYYESYSHPIFFPINQWANIQFSMSQYDGYQI